MFRTLIIVLCCILYATAHEHTSTYEYEHADIDAHGSEYAYKQQHAQKHGHYHYSQHASKDVTQNSFTTTDHVVDVDGDHEHLPNLSTFIPSVPLEQYHDLQQEQQPTAIKPILKYDPVTQLTPFQQLKQQPYTVTYDHRSLLINDQRILLVGGEIHYPRMTPAMWAQVLNETRGGGNMNFIQTYFFWNYHEVAPGVYDWETESRNLGKFLQTAADVGLFVFLRLGPFACAEWNYGAIPFRLRQEEGIIFRYVNEKWQTEMQNVLEAVLKYIEPYLARNGGPVMLLQIENEYAHVGASIGPLYKEYLQWVVNLTTTPKFNVGLWVMCSEPDAPANIINTCNGMYCDTFVESHAKNFPNQPAIWSEAYPTFYQHWSEAMPTRPLFDMAYAIAKFFARGGSQYGLYMQFGGTNFGRHAGNSDGTGIGITTSYYTMSPVSPLDTILQPNFFHLSDMYEFLTYYSPAILNNPYATPQSLGDQVTAFVYGKIGAEDTVVFLANDDDVNNHTVQFNNQTYTIPAWSVSFLQGSNLKVMYNTATLYESKTPNMKSVSRKNRIQYPPQYISSLPEIIGHWNESAIITTKEPVEQLDYTLDTTDYLWYSTQVTLTQQQIDAGQVSLTLSLVNDILYFFLNNTLVGQCQNIGKNPEKVMLNVAGFQPNEYTLTILSMTMGLRNSGAHMEDVVAGLNGVIEWDGTDIRSQSWMQSVGLQGEAEEYFNPQSGTKWNDNYAAYTPATWYEINIAVSTSAYPPYEIDLSSMGKGAAYVNGHHIGRYWNITATASTCEPCDYRGTYNENKCRIGCGQASQSLYFVPAEWIVVGSINSVVLFEEIGGYPDNVQILGYA